MVPKNRSSFKFLAIVFMLCITKVCHGQLMCYVCDDCDKISMQTPLFECNENYFNGNGPNNSSQQTTTEHSTTAIENVTTSTEDTTQTTTTATTQTTTKATTKDTTQTTTKATTMGTTEITTLKEIETTQATTSTTEEQPPSPPTEGAPKSTTSVPTPPTPDTLKPIDDVENLNNPAEVHDQQLNTTDVESVDADPGTVKSPYKTSAELRVRQRRAVSDVSFHCFKVKATTANGTMIVNRGCSRIHTNESVCGQWESQHPMEKMNKCYPCSRTKCNGSSALSVSITALLAAAVALFMHRK